MHNYYVYHLIDPRTGNPFYVGKGKGKRMYSHERLILNGHVPNGNRYLYNKIKKLWSLGLSIAYTKVAENLPENEALEREVFEIGKYGIQGSGILCNLTNGGEGVSGFHHSETAKKKMSLIARRRLENPFNHPFYGRTHSEASKKLSSDSTKRRFSDPRERQKTAELTRKGMYSSGHIDRVSKEISMMSPDGILVTAKNISQFCRDHNLQNGNLYKVINGKIQSHKGWTLPQKENAAP